MQLPQSFEVITSESIAHRLFKLAEKEKSESTLWTKKKERFLTCFFKSWDDEKHTLSFMHQDQSALDRFYENVLDRSEACLVNIQTSKANVFFETSVLGCEEEDDEYALDYPKKIYRIQRRIHPRTPVLKAYTIMAQMIVDLRHKSDKIQGKLVDVNLEGAAFLLTPSEVREMKKGLIIDRITFSLRGESVICSAEVMNISPLKVDIEDGRSYRVGTKFVKVAPESIEAIADFSKALYRGLFTEFV